MGLDFGPQQCYSGQKLAPPGVCNSTVQNSKLNNSNQVKKERLEFETKQIKKLRLELVTKGSHAKLLIKIKCVWISKLKKSEKLRLEFGTKQLFLKANQGIFQQQKKENTLQVIFVP